MCVSFCNLLPFLYAINLLILFFSCTQKLTKKDILGNTITISPKESETHETSHNPKKIHCSLREATAEQQDAKKNEIQELKNPLLQQIYQDGLTQDRAVQFALVNNPDLLAFYKNLDIAYADLIED